jgi:hypothetical protein
MSHSARVAGLAAAQGVPVRLETACAALLEVDMGSWEDAFADGVQWKLVDVVGS